MTSTASIELLTLARETAPTAGKLARHDAGEER